MDILDSLKAGLTVVATFIPAFLLFLVILIVGLLIAKAISTALSKVLHKVGFDRLVERGALKDAMAKSSLDASDIIAKIVYYALVLFVLQFAFGVFGPNPVSVLLAAIIAFLPKIVVAIIIVVISAAIAAAVKTLIQGSLGGLSYGKVLANIASIFILGIGVIAALNQVDIATTVTTPILIAVLAAIVGVVVVGVGGGLIKPMSARWERYLNRAEEEAPKIKAHAQAAPPASEQIKDAAAQYRTHGWQAVYGSSGTIRAINEVIGRNRLGDGTMSFDSLLVLRDRLIAAGRADAFDLPGIKRERVIVMAGGLSVLIGAMQEFGVRAMTAINAGLRLGVLSDFELRAQRSDRRDSAVQDCMRRFGVDEQRALRTAAIARQLFDRLGAGDDSLRRHLLWSCMLHEVGQAVSHTGAHKHAAYIVEHADLPGFTNREQRLMGTIVLAQKGNLRKVREALGDPGLLRAVLAIRLAAVFMHARVDGDLAALGLRMKNRIEIDTPRGWLKQHPTVAAWFDKEAAAWGELGIPFQVAQI